MTHIANIALSLAANQDGTAPEWIQLLPTPPTVAGRDGRSWTYNADEVMAAFGSRGRAIALDWEHSSSHRAPHGLDAPAAGWIVDMQARSDGIWGKVEWTERGRAQVAAREYRFISPALTFDKENNHIHEIVHAGLTNQPNLTLQALNQRTPSLPQSKENPMDLSQIALALGLASNATEAQIVAKIKDNHAELQTALNQRQNPDTDQFVPKADYELAINRAETAEKQLADQPKAQLQCLNPF